MAIIKVKELTRNYQRGAETVRAVNNVSLEVETSDFLVIHGASGSGKSTLLNLLGCLDNPDGGEITVSGREIFKPGMKLSEGTLTKIRRENFGYIFQKFYLIPTLTVFENIVLPGVFYCKDCKEKVLARANQLLAELGIDKRRDHLPGEISGGEMQRVGIARALVNNPAILLADEPTGNLDSKRANEIGEILTKLNRENKKTIIMVTHNQDLAKLASRKIELSDGQIIFPPCPGQSKIVHNQSTFL
ncbi:MAG: ABC-type antimicrobial peptide transport system ATPase component [Candidatus Saganbacteria bacterium]|uniref:ABC-type antimicrobial peptide transport system ATPase component n=1 Tax=Candidatus Saganbacteria bacterium TaxID=2575572 RepID=A0A833L1I4_UNCSA|nr:MAG: ABC-type antimicrobial peptide transport system ATPase component [Candidatus Saganbacteria bacterium]